MEHGSNRPRAGDGSNLEAKLNSALRLSSQGVTPTQCNAVRPYQNLYTTPDTFKQWLCLAYFTTVVIRATASSARKSSSFFTIQGCRLPSLSLGFRVQPVEKRFALGSKRGNGCASVFRTI